MGWLDWLRPSKAQTTEDLIAQAEAARPPVAGPTPDAPHDPAEQIAELVRKNKKIEAIKLHRSTYGTGLKEAKDAIDALASGRTPAAHPAPTKAPASEAQVIKYIDEGKLIDAIKAYREIHGTGLKESKDAVDAIVAQRASGERPR
jgi:ribosomal protein L7/L12